VGKEFSSAFSFCHMEIRLELLLGTSQILKVNREYPRLSYAAHQSKYWTERDDIVPRTLRLLFVK
jgi:hypothetical protein